MRDSRLANQWNKQHMHPKAQVIIEQLHALPESRAPKLELEPAAGRLNYLIFFTPRSGSSWLTELLKTNGMGEPKEWFNPNLIPKIAKRLRTRSVDDYISAVSHAGRDKDTHVFGSELTYFHLAILRDMAKVFKHFPISQTYFFYLRRRDIVQQAISLYRATSTGEFHSVQLDGSPRKTAEYDSDAIEKWLRHILKQELGFHKVFLRSGITPLTLTYERMLEVGSEAVLNFFTVPILGDQFSREPRTATRHSKLINPETADWPERFRQDRPALLAEVERNRPAITSDL
jgi:trehalose 2-sulfotransferase